LSQDSAKRNAAEEAVKLVKNGMTVGLGTGSTAAIAVDLIGEKLSDNFQVVGMPTSIQTQKQAEKYGMKLIDIDDKESIEIAIDGADEVSDELNLIKGLGGALLREKKVEKKAKELIIIVDESKMVGKLGVGPLPVEVEITNHNQTSKEIGKLGCRVEHRIENNGRPFVTDNGNYIYHCHFNNGIDNPKNIDRNLLDIDGVVDTGLFIEMATKVIVGNQNGTKIIE